MEVYCVGDPGAPPKGTLDPEILAWCEVHDFILVTNNHSTMPSHLADHLAAGRHVPGVFQISGDRTIELVEELVLIELAQSRLSEGKGKCRAVAGGCRY